MIQTDAKLFHCPLTPISIHLPPWSGILCVSRLDFYLRHIFKLTLIVRDYLCLLSTVQGTFLKTEGQEKKQKGEEKKGVKGDREREYGPVSTEGISSSGEMRSTLCSAKFPA